MFNPINFTQDSLCFGRGVVFGGGGKAPKMPADNSLELERMRIQQANEERQRQEAREQQQRELFTQRRGEATTAARTTAQSELTRRGLDPTRYMPGLESEIQRIAAGIPDLDVNPGGYFGPEFVEGALQREQTGVRDRFGRDVQTQFAPGFDTSAVAPTLDDALLDSILETQAGEARGTLERARQRGQLNDVGFNEATRALENQRTSGRSTLSDIGDVVLNRYRGELSDIRNRASTAASNWTLGSPDFSIDPYRSEFETARAGIPGRLEGDIRSAVGGTNVFDIGELLQTGSRGQGATSGALGSEDDLIYSALAGTKKKSKTDRGVGSTGVF